MKPLEATRVPVRRLGLLLAVLMAACSPTEAAAPPTTASRTPVPTTETPLPSVTATRQIAVTPARTATPDAYAGLTISDLAARSYGGGTVEVYDSWRTPSFSRLFFTYESDGVIVHGFANVPFGDGPFPVVLVLHGYVDPRAYQTLAYTRVYADALAEAGFLVLHPNYRNHPPSAVGPNPFRIGYAIDVLNLISLLHANAGRPGPFEKAQADAIGLLGHSMGGGIALRAITVDAGKHIDAAVLYGSMSGDERANYEKILEWTEGRTGWEELNTPQDALERISPIYHLTQIEAAVSIHHGEDDGTVPPAWSADLCERLVALAKPVECFNYPEQPHTFFGDGESLFLERVIAFFRATLR